MRSPVPQSVLVACVAGLAAASHHFNPPPQHRQLARGEASSDAAEVEMVASAWYTEWHSQGLPLDSVPWDKYTHLNYAFKLSTEDPSDISLPEADAQLLPQFVAKAHENGVKALMSYGGWTGSIHFSTNVGDATNRTKFVQAVVQFVNQYQLDGVDFDWEYPFRQGIGCNSISSDDTANFLAFLQELKSQGDFLITAAVSLFPFNDETGSPSKDVSGFAEVFDHIVIMNYDVWGAWSSAVGPNAPLNDTCAAPQNQQGSAVSAVAAWTSAGMPANKIVLGVPAYGHAFAVDPSAAFDGDRLAAYPPNTGRGAGDCWSDPAGTDICGNETPAGDTWAFWSLVDADLLLDDGSAAPGVPYRFDDCSKTEYIYDVTSGAMISYDGPKAFAAKGEFIKSMGLRGFAMWEAAGDYNDLLTDSIREAAGFDDCDE